MIWPALAVAALAAAAWFLRRLPPLRIRVRSSTAGGAAAAPEGHPASCQAAVQALGERLDALAAHLREIERTPSPEAAVFPRPALNLSKRSRALRLYRRGESPEQIATALEVSRQEIDLLLKIHRMILDGLPPAAP